MVLWGWVGWYLWVAPEFSIDQACECSACTVHGGMFFLLPSLACFFENIRTGSIWCGWMMVSGALGSWPFVSCQANCNLKSPSPPNISSDKTRKRLRTWALTSDKLGFSPVLSYSLLDLEQGSPSFCACKRRNGASFPWIVRVHAKPFAQRLAHGART